MNFDSGSFDIVNQIQLLERWILVQSFAYYELNENIASDFQYDANAKQLEELVHEFPKEANMSRYCLYFEDFFDGSDHSTSGFNLIERVRKNNYELYKLLHIDAALALEMKRKGE